MISLSMDQDEIVFAKSDAFRPSNTNLGSTQGDHTTPFTVLQNQVVNSIQKTFFDDAWVNLEDTFEHYQTLPGWATTKKWVRDGYSSVLKSAFANQANLNELCKAANNMLHLRNQIDFTALPNGGHGKGEGTWAGSLHYQERQLQMDKGTTATQYGVICYMWKAFDHERVNNLGTDKRTNTLRQHCMTIIDAYPMLSGRVGLNADTLLANYNKENWLTWKDGKGK